MKEVCASPHIEDVPKILDENVQFIINLKFQYDNMCENVHNVSLEDKTSIEDDEMFYLFGIFKEEEQPTLDLQIDLIVQSNFCSKIKLKRLQ